MSDWLKAPFSESDIAGVLFRSMRDAALLVDIESLRVVAANSGGERVFGLNKSTLSDRPLTELLSIPVAGSELQNWLRTSSTERVSALVTDAKGHSNHIELVNHAVTQGGQTFALLMIESRRRNEPIQLHFESLKAHVNVPEGSNVGCWAWDSAAGRFYSEPAFRELLGLDRNVEVGLDVCIRCLHVDEQSAFSKAWKTVISEGRESEGDYRVNLDDGTQRLIRCTFRKADRDRNEPSPIVVGLAREIEVDTSVFEAPIAYGHSALKLQELIRSVDGFAWEFDLSKEVFSYVSPTVELMLGYPRSRWLTEVGFFGSILHPEDRDQVLTYCAERTSDDVDHVMEYRMIDSRGAIHNVRDLVYLKRNLAGQVTHLHGLVLDETEHLEVKKLLRLTKERSEQLFNDSPISLWVLDCTALQTRFNQLLSEGHSHLGEWLVRQPQELVSLANSIRVTNVNRATLELFGRQSVNDFCFRVSELFRDDSMAGFAGWILALAGGQLSYDFDNVLYGANGERYLTQIRTSVAPGQEHDLSCIYASVVDITKRKQAEMLRDGQRNVLQRLASGIPVAEVLTTLAAEVENQSPYLHCSIFVAAGNMAKLKAAAVGKTAQELVLFLDGRRIADVPLPDGLTESFTNQALQTDGTFENPKQSRLRESLCQLAALQGYHVGATLRIVGTHQESLGLMLVTRTDPGSFTPHEKDVVQSFLRLAGVVLEHEFDRQSLETKTLELESVFRAYPDAMFRIDRQGNLLERYSGDRISSLLRSRMSNAAKLEDLMPPEVSGRIQKAIEQILHRPEVRTVDFDWYHQNRNQSFEVRFIPIPQSSDIIVVIRDVTKLKETEAALRTAGEQFRRLFDESPTAIFVETVNGVVLDANLAACRLHLMSREELVGKQVLDLVPPDDRNAVISRTGTMVAGELNYFEATSLRADGSTIPVSVSVSTIEYGDSPALLLHVRDISEDRRQQELRRIHEHQLAHMSRLTIMGQLVAGIAHEIRQPLWSSATFADVALEILNKQQDDGSIERVRELVQKLSVATRRANAITTRMLAFARKGQPDRDMVDIKELLRSAIEFTQLRADNSKVTTVLSAIPELPLVLCDRVLIEQTTVNLLNNAYQALSFKTQGKRQVTVGASLDHEFVTISVADNGPGLPEGVKSEQLFESFFTTERSGMGIGLALCRSFVSEHGGTIWAEPNPGGGMLFQFTLRLDGVPDANAAGNSICR